MFRQFQTHAWWLSALAELAVFMIAVALAMPAGDAISMEKCHEPMPNDSTCLF